MSSTDDKTQVKPIEVLDWNSLMQYTLFLAQGDEKRIKICMIDEEQDEIRLQSKEEFETNVQCARDQGCTSLKLVIYKDEQFLFDGIYHVAKQVKKPTAFPTDKLQSLVDRVLTSEWYIPVKQEEAFGVCLTAAIQLAQQNKLESNADCQRFIETIIPEAFTKLLNTPCVPSWPREIQSGIFEMLELLIDLVGIRIRSTPVPVTLLNVLGFAFDANTAFAQRHKYDDLPNRRAYTLVDEEFLRKDFKRVKFGWLRSILQRFIAQDGLKNLSVQFEYIHSSNSKQATNEYNVLLKVFSQCHLCINAHRFRLIFGRAIHQAKQYAQRQPASNEIQQLNQTITDLCGKYEIKDEFDQILSSLFNPTISEISIAPLIELPCTNQRKSKSHDCYERLADDIRSMTMGHNDAEERKNIKKQRTDEQTSVPLFTHHQVNDCIDEFLNFNDKHSLKRKHRREQQRSTLTSINSNSSSKKELKRSNTISMPCQQTYDRSNPEDVLRYFAPMKLKVANLYGELQLAMARGKLRDVVKIEEKLKLLRPYSARFIADENTPDGTIMQPGQSFCKGWIVFNDGSLPWDSNDIQLVNLSDGIPMVRRPIIPVTAPHDKAVITVDYVCPTQAGFYESKWILAYRQQTFGPMIWCTIEVRPSMDTPLLTQSMMKLSTFDPLEEAFELIDVPLPPCFDLTKPFQSEKKSRSHTDSLNSSFSSHRENSINGEGSAYQSLNTSDTLSNSSSSSSSSSSVSLKANSIPTSTNEVAPLIELAPTNETPSARPNPSLDFVDTVVTNIFSVAKQAGSTAKAIFNTLQAYEEPTTTCPIQEPKKEPTLINTYQSEQNSVSSFFDPIRQTSTSDSRSFSSMDPMARLVEMGFANRSKNQRLLRENGNDLAKVVELLTRDTLDDSDWFYHRH